MNDLDLVFRFIESFCKAEYEALISQSIERDSNIYKAKCNAVEEFLVDGVSSDLNRPGIPDEGWFVQGNAAINGGWLVPRTIFQIKAYLHPQFERIYRIYASYVMKPAPGHLGYFVNIFVRNISDRYYIFSRYDLNDVFESRGAKIVDNDIEWVWHSGVEIKELGNLINVKKVVPPEEVASLAEYQKE